MITAGVSVQSKQITAPPPNGRQQTRTQKRLTAAARYAIIKMISIREVVTMEHIKTIETRNLCESAKNGGCGECQTSCQSACKTSCGIANQQCENEQ